MKHDIDKQWFHNQLRMRRKSVRALARFMDIDTSAVSRMLSGQRAMKAAEQDRIAAFLELPVREVAAHRGLGSGDSGARTGLGEMTQSEYEMVGSAAAGAQPKPKHPLFGSMKGTTIVMPGVDLTEPADPDLLHIYDEDYDPQQMAVERIQSDIGLSRIGKIWKLDDLGVDKQEIASGLDINVSDVDDALAARQKVRGW